MERWGFSLFLPEASSLSTGMDGSPFHCPDPWRREEAKEKGFVIWYLINYLAIWG